MHVDINSDGFDVDYKGATVNVLMATEAASDGLGETLTAGPFAADPRTNHVEQSPHNGVDDPPNKTALLWEPFLYGDVQTWSWHSGDVTSTVHGFPDVNYLAGETAALQSDGYKVKLLEGGTGGIVDLIKALSGGAPGLLLVRTHGYLDGTLFTNDYLGNTNDSAIARRRPSTPISQRRTACRPGATAVGALNTEEILPGAKRRERGLLPRDHAGLLVMDANVSRGRLLS